MNLEGLTDAVVKGRREDAKSIVGQAIQQKVSPATVLDAMIAGMDRTGELFKEGEIFVPEMLLAARAMKEGVALLEPLLVAAGIRPKFTVVIGTVQGDLHDIGKNLVAMMWRGANFKVIDVGVNASPEKFVEAARANQAQLIGLSALLTTTMPAMKTTVAAIRAGGLNSIKIVIGGAPVSEEFAREIGADAYSRDAADAVEVARQLMAA